MRIIDVAAEVFTYTSEVERDAEGHSHPGHAHQATQSMVRIVTDEGVEGYCFGGNPTSIQKIVRPALTAYSLPLTAPFR